MSHIAVPKKGCCSNGPVFCVDDCIEETSNSRDVQCCYDADTSNSSLDLSHDEVSQDSHHRGFGEAAARGAKSSNFYPISEDTVFLDSPPIMPSSSSPFTMENWMVYSNSSSDEYSLSGQFNGGGSSNDDTSDFELPTVQKGKSNYNCQSLHFEDLELEDEEDEELSPPLTRKNITKRLRVKNTNLNKQTTSGTCRNRSSTPVQVDVRMIDFAHTSFLRKSSSESNTQNNTQSGVVHQGPDGGFLQGLDSLKKLLLEILEED